jgi:hypothetical protein
LPVNYGRNCFIKSAPDEEAQHFTGPRYIDVVDGGSEEVSGRAGQNEEGALGKKPKTVRDSFVSKECPNCTSETVKARSFLITKIFLLSLKRSSFYSF